MAAVGLADQQRLISSRGEVAVVGAERDEGGAAQLLDERLEEPLDDAQRVPG